jgi:hypothetical protein
MSPWRLLDVLADRLTNPHEPPGRDASEHPVHHRPRQRVAVGEVISSGSVIGQALIVSMSYSVASSPTNCERSSPTSRR